ncbi:MAG: DUF3089 domain-containing protein [Clostridia bacterium]|nr:DUF3089 domain-containing protein [Clostridia bacterium]
MTFTDYSNSFNWISTGGERDKPVDVFHVVPTSWYGKEGETLSEISNPQYREMSTFNVSFQASVFETEANIFAPHYRQLEPYYCLDLSLEERMKKEAEEPKQDIFDALDYYFENYNNGRPFILSGHSQGSILLLSVLSEYMFMYPERYERMIAAYLIGYSVTEEYLREHPHLHFAEGAGDTGVIISYNTQSPSLTSPNPLVNPGALVINPISWTRSEELAPASQSLGSRIKGRDIPHFADARIDKSKNALICSTPDPRRMKSELFEEGVYHIHDYGLYYYDLRQNAALRIANYMKNL